jgi:hypothetical protein
MIGSPMVVGSQAGKRHFTSNYDASQTIIEAGDSSDLVTIAGDTRFECFTLLLPGIAGDTRFECFTLYIAGYCRGHTL